MGQNFPKVFEIDAFRRLYGSTHTIFSWLILFKRLGFSKVRQGISTVFSMSAIRPTTGYPLLRKASFKFSAWRWKSSSLVQLRLNLRIWLKPYGKNHTLVGFVYKLKLKVGGVILTIVSRKVTWSRDFSIVSLLTGVCCWRSHQVDLLPCGTMQKMSSINLSQILGLWVQESRNSSSRTDKTM